MGIMKKKRRKISEQHHIFEVKREVAEYAKRLGFSEKEIEEISIAVTELGKNLIKHQAIEGEIFYSSFEEGEKKGLELISFDKGPGIANIEAVMEDGYSSKKSLGIGLGAVKRMMNDISIESATIDLPTPSFQGENIIGTKITSRKYLRSEEITTLKHTKRMTFSVFTRSKFGEIFNGDNYVLKHFETKTLFGVIDGLGHGQGASIASNKAQLCILKNYSESLEEIIEILHDKLRNTRGAALSLGLIDHEAKTFNYIGIGNVLTRVFNSSSPINPLNYNGTLGVSLKKFKKFEYPWDKNNIIIMTSDGISSKYTLEDIFEILHEHPMVIGHKIFKNFGKIQDDATILVGGPS